MGIVRRLKKIRADRAAVRSAAAAPDPARKTVLVLVDSLYGGGAERAACQLASELAASYRVILLYWVEKTRRYDIDPAVEIRMIPNFLQDIERNRIRFVRRLKRTAGVFCTVSFLYELNRLNVSAPFGKTVCCERNNPAKKEPEHMEEIRRIYEVADRVVFQSEAVRGLFDEGVREKSVILPNPVEEPAYVRTAERHSIVAVGRLHAQKNQAMLIRAFGAFHAARPDYTLEIYGDGEARVREELEQLILKLGLADCVHLNGNVPDVHERIAGDEIFVLSSDYEGFSNALLECMMMGFPCISTACEGSVDVIRDGENGLLIPVGDERALTAAMERLAADPAFAEGLGRAARRSALEYRKETAVRKWVEMIEQL